MTCCIILRTFYKTAKHSCFAAWVSAAKYKFRSCSTSTKCRTGSGAGTCDDPGEVSTAESASAVPLEPVAGLKHCNADFSFVRGWFVYKLNKEWKMHHNFFQEIVSNRSSQAEHWTYRRHLERRICFVRNSSQKVTYKIIKKCCFVWYKKGSF